MGFGAGKVAVQIFGDLKAPLVVGKYAIFDTASTVPITDNLPTKPGKERADPDDLDGFSAPFFVPIPADAPLSALVIHDRGQGLQELRGRPLGQLVFTRVGNGTADGSFQALVYRLITNALQQVEYQGRPRALLKLEEHTVKGIFKNLPFGDYEKSMGDLRKVLKAAEGLR